MGEDLLGGRYRRLQNLGTGAYSSVYSAIDTWSKDEEKVAIKDVVFHNSKEGVPSTSIREVSILKNLDHVNIVALRDVVHEFRGGRDQLTLVLEFIEYDLKQYLEAENYSTPALRSSFRQFLEAVKHVHGVKIMHRDLKPQNILVHHNGTLKLCDFGLAREFGLPCEARTQEVVTLWYRAPEILLGWKDYTCASDIWSVGCILAEIWNARTLFPGDSEIDQLHRIFRICGTPDETVWAGCSKLPNYRGSFPDWPRQSLNSEVPKLDPAGCDLLEQLLRFDPSERMDAKDALLHPFILESPHEPIPVHQNQQGGGGIMGAMGQQGGGIMGGQAMDGVDMNQPTVVHPGAHQQGNNQMIEEVD